MNELPETSSSNGVGEIGDLETLDYLRGVKSSTCLLLTPSPTPIDFKHPLSEENNEESFLGLDDDLTDSKMVTLQNPDVCAGDSSSSADSNSVVQDPVSAQLINNISMLDYQTLSKNGDIIMGQPEGYKLNGSLNINNRKLPSFVNWNWGRIRKVLLWFVLSGLVACLGAIIAMVVTMPKTCNPDLPWYQGKVFYEVFPASFKDSNNDGVGDLKGMIKKLDYIKDLGVSTIHMNYIFESHNYPEHYYNTTSLFKIDRSIGVVKDFEELITTLHNKGMHIILDIPVLSMAVPISYFDSNHTSFLTHNNIVNYTDVTTVALKFWAQAQNVDGFYLKNLERYVKDENFGKSLQIWKEIIGSNKILMASEETFDSVIATKDSSALTIFLNRVDLIDVHLDLKHGINGLKDKINKVVPQVLWSEPHYPWIHWNIGNVNSERMSTKDINNTLALTALEFILPGTVSIFYGDEVGLGSSSRQDVESDYHEHENLHNLVPMMFKSNDKISDDKKLGILPWNSKSVSEPKYEYLDIIKDFINVHLNSPTIYLKAIYRDGNVLKNMEIRKSDENLLVIERWYPRRNTCVFVGNLGSKAITTDLSAMFYGGIVVAATDSSLVGQVLYLDSVTFPPHSGLILKLGK